MRNILTNALVGLALCLVHYSFADFIDSRYLAKVKSTVARQYGAVPAQVTELLAVLDKNLNFLRCLPTEKVDWRCYESPSFCSHPKLRVGGKALGLKFGFCKSPWTIKIGFKLPRSPWYLKWGFGPMVIPIHINDRDGVVKVNSVTKGDVKALGFFKLVKAQISIDGIIRWDCTRPEHDRAVRVRYNSGYNDDNPGIDYNKLYYKLHVKMEVKKKRFPCFCYRCYKDYCRDVVNTKGHFATGPTSCIKDVEDYNRKNLDNWQKRWKDCAYSPWLCRFPIP